MSREIKFRAWDTKGKTMSSGVPFDWFLGQESQDMEFPKTDETLPVKDFIFFRADYKLMELVEENTPMKREVYVGDILKAYRRDDNAKKKPVFSEVTFLNGCYMAFNCTWHELYRLWQSDFVVAGNIYETPELLTP